MATEQWPTLVPLTWHAKVKGGSMLTYDAALLRK
jgi:hypothetical protein